MPINRTVSEFSSRRKITYGNEGSQNRDTFLGPRLMQSDAAISPHKNYYAKLDNGDDAYIIEFNIGHFQFDELQIRTEGQKLFVQAQTTEGAGGDELHRELKKEFNLPKDVDPNSIKAHLDEKNRELRLTGIVTSNFAQTNQFSEATDSFSEHYSVNKQKIGSIRETKGSNSIDFEVYLGDQLKDGQIIFEVPNLVTLNVRVIKTETDEQGSFVLELKRELKLPMGAKLNNINHGIDNSTNYLLIQVPLK